VLYPIHRPRAVAAFAVAVALALPAAASAHVTLQPSTAPAGGFTRLDVRVPNERDDAGTTQIRLQLPPGFAFVSYEPRPGWKVTVKKVKLEEPVKTEDGFEIDEGIGEITWSGDGKQGIIRPGQFADFGLSVKIPDGQPGDKLTFKALQTYSNGEVVRWIGAPGSDEPAPQVTVVAPAASGATASAHHDSGSGTIVKSTSSTPPSSPAVGSDSSDSVLMAGLGALGALLLGGAVTLLRRRRSDSPAATA
jgi:uncharacterized protein YcnI